MSNKIPDFSVKRRKFTVKTVPTLLEVDTNDEAIRMIERALSFPC